MRFFTGTVSIVAIIFSVFQKVEYVSSTNIAQGEFSSIGCNTDTSSCIPFSTFFGYVLTPEVTAIKIENKEKEELVIPCDECISMGEFTNDQLIIFEHGVNIQGTLFFPNTTRVHVQSTYIIVEGHLEMHSITKVDGKPSITISMKGTRDYYNFIPHPINEAACKNKYQRFCDVGKKAIIVAGGSVNINAIPDTCPMWVNLKRIIGADPPVIPEDEILQPTELPAHCSRILLSTDFNDGLGVGVHGWKSGTGAYHHWIEEDSFDGTPYMKVTGRTKNWQGAYTFITPAMKECIVPETKYLLRMAVRLDNTTEKMSDCQRAYGNFTNCPSLRLHWVDGWTNYFWETLHTLPRKSGLKDGEWMEYRAEFEFSEDHFNQYNKYDQIYIAGPEEGIDISVDNIQIEIPDWGFPNLTDPCADLVVNGDAELHRYHPWPWTRAGNVGAYVTVEKEKDGNQYFKVTGRRKVYTSIDQQITAGCIRQYALYEFKARIWARSENTTVVRPNLRLEGGPNLGKSFKTKSIGYCPNSSEAIGWINCSYPIMFFPEDVEAEKVFINIVVYDETADVYYDDVSLELINHPVEQIVVDSSVNECWDVGADILLTSYSMSPKDNKNFTIVEMNTYGDETFIKLNNQTETYTSLEDDENYAVEVALLSREIVFTSLDDDFIYKKKHGAHFMILQTPEVPQLIQGVEFRGMGQQGSIGRYPFHYHISYNNPGSIIAKNTIRESQQRCIVIHSTHNVTIYENIAFDTLGHCFFLEDGFEQDNVFERNLGALTRIMPASGVISITESDEFASTYWMSNPKNFFYENVAAGGEDTGFWYEFQAMLRGPSVIFDPYYHVNPSEFPFGDFRGQIIHSNVGDGFKLYPNGYFPEERATYKDMKSYRNKGDGVLFHNSENLGIDGGLFADNRIQIEVDKQADDVRVSNCKVYGYTDSFQRAVKYAKKVSHCPAHRPLAGVQLHSFLRFKDSDGYRLTNIDFYNFGFEATGGCVGSAAIEMDPQVQEGHFDAYSAFRDLRFHPEGQYTMAEKFSACALFKSGIRDMAIQDQTGDLNPTLVKTPGYIVSNSTIMTKFLDCIPMEGSCTMYCPNPTTDPNDQVCFRALNLAISMAEEYQGLMLTIENVDTGIVNYVEGYFNNHTKIIYGEPIKEGNRTYPNHTEVEDVFENFGYMRRRFFTPTLPKGRYTMTFTKNEQVVWPRFVEMVWERQDDCANSLQTEDLELSIPTPTQGECDTDIVLNGDVEQGRNHWMHTGSSLKVVSPGYDNSKFAIATVHRKGPWQGLGQFLDSRCFTLGDTLEVEAMYQLRDDGKPYQCDFSAVRYMGNLTCPRVSMRMRKLLGDEISSEVQTDYMYPLGVGVGPTVAGWNKLYGRFKVTQAMVEAHAVYLFIERGKPGSELVIDNLAVRRVQKTGCGDQFLNRDLETGDTRDWTIRGSETKIDMHSPGYNSKYAIRTRYRDDYWMSMSQEIDSECINAGMKYQMSSRIRLKDANENWIGCDINEGWGHIPTIHLVCPIMTLMYWTGNTTSSMQDVGTYSKEFDEGQWNLLRGEFIATNEVANADKIIVFWSKVQTNYSIFVDDFSIKTMGMDGCNKLIWNGDAEDGNIGYWDPFGEGKVGLETGGAKGSQFAISSSGRNSPEDGLQQSIDLECLKGGEIYRLTANIRLRSDDGKSWLTCDAATTNDYASPERCPQISLYTEKDGTYQERAVASVTQKFNPDQWNEISGYFAFLPSEVHAENLYVVINKGREDADILVDDLKLTTVDIDNEVQAYE